MVTGFDSLKVEIADQQDPLATASPTFTDITTDLQTMTINRGRDAQWDSYSSGGASFVFKDNYGTVFPNTIVRVSVNDSTSTRRNLFSGFLRPQMGVTVEFANSLSTSTIQAVDLLALLSERTLDTEIAGNDFTGNVMENIITAYPGSFPAWASDGIDRGETIMQGLPAGGSLLDAFQNLAFSEGGAFYVDRDGNWVHDGRMAIFNGASRLTTSQVTFDDLGAGGAATYATRWVLWFPPVYTRASVTRANDDSLTTIVDGVPKQGPQTFTFSDASAIANYGEASFPSVTGALMSSNTEAQALAQRLALTSNSLQKCPKTIRLYPRRTDAKPSDAALDAAVNRELRDRCLFKNVGAGMSVGANVHVERIQHTIDTSSKEWTCDLSFSSRDQLLFNYDPDNWFILGDATHGKLDDTQFLTW